ncbi:MAG: acyltransferase [Alphaproteobacteria bacterium]
MVGLDSIRFICALIVVFAHTGQPPITTGIDTSTSLGWAVHALGGVLWSSAAAVIVFFVISGFCIHYPFARTNSIPSLLSYYPRRYVRIVVPVLAAIWLSSLVGLSLKLFNGSILWSLAAELIYYTIYPVLLIARRRLKSWLPLVGVAFVAALGVAASNLQAHDYPSFGLQLNWLLGLPCWLAGCQLADYIASRPPARPVPFIWVMRLGIWAGMSGCMILRYHSPLGYQWTLNVFALLVAVWLAFEIRQSVFKPPSPKLEWLGTWSYSLYLTHKMAVIVYEKIGVPDLGYLLSWAVRLTFVLACAYLFYLVCERPAHILARIVARMADRLVQSRTVPAHAKPPA